ncbi:MAG: DUF4244 domain-containing protein [Actinobacteria bacterium]|nr:DUF4244 domain-containing protein [Actinomycetota bacterium]
MRVTSIRRTANLRTRRSRPGAPHRRGHPGPQGRRRHWDRFRTLRATRRARSRAVLGDAGMATAEYAIVTLAAVGFAGLLLVILKSGTVRELLLGIIRTALSA